MDQTIYRDGKVLTRNAFQKTLLKTLNDTGEHDVWEGSAATMPQPDGVSTLSITSSSEQDSALTYDTWTVEETGGSDIYVGVVVDGVTHRAAVIAALADAINDGTAETWGIIVSVLPSFGEGVDIDIGAESYQWLLTIETTVDEAAAAIAAVLAGDPLYTCTAIGGGSGAVICIANTPAVETADIVLTLTDDGTIEAVEVFGHGPASTTHTASEAAGVVAIVSNTVGEPSTVTADTDNLTLVHTITGGPGTGIRSVRVSYLDDLDLVRSEVVELAGLTAATTTYDAVKLLDIVAHSSGPGGAAGSITITDGDPTTIATITAGDSEVKRFAYSVPTAGNPPGSWYLTNLQASTSNAAGSTLRVRISGPRGSWLACAVIIPPGMAHMPTLESPVRIIPGETLRITLEGNGSTTIVSMSGYGEGVSA